MRFNRYALTNARIKNWLNLIGFILSSPFYILGYFIPKDKNLWVIANRFGFKDNPRYLFDFIRQNHPEVKAIWITKNKDEVSAAENRLYAYDPKAIFLQYRAKTKILSTGGGDLAKFTCANSTLIQLWHGSPLKRILLDSHAEKVTHKESTLNSLYQFILKKSLARYDMVIAPSPLIQKRLMSAFAKTEDQVPITGYPRIDFILEQAKNINELHSQLKPRPKKVILYAPTWRNDPQRFKAHVDLLINANFNDFLNANDFHLICSLHPLSNYQSICPTLNRISLNEKHDINYLVAQVDILITDYSSIFYDFSVLQRPVIFFAMDIDIYTKNRGLYEDYRLLCKDRLATSESELQHLLVKHNEITLLDSTLYNEHNDSQSRARVYKQIQTIK